MEFDDDMQVFFVCKHPRQLDREMGPGEPGGDCALYDGGRRAQLSPQLQRMLEESAKRKSREREER